MARSLRIHPADKRHIGWVGALFLEYLLTQEGDTGEPFTAPITELQHEYRLHTKQIKAARATLIEEGVLTSEGGPPHGIKSYTYRIDHTRLRQWRDQ